MVCYAMTEAIVRYGYAWLALDPLFWKAVAVGVTMVISFTWMSCAVFCHKEVDDEPVVSLSLKQGVAPEPEFVVVAEPVEDVVA